ncbi:HlyD family type I secretion periplasmic adaptor subunit [Pseudooceanicola sp. CBS1P-1]|uniref:Membrane fusion protein (MFP) family protein n=1 Tax=Pseudooceanicola albus TaxID=2692189 RepID=A0A6L7G6T0_9RHOB|nr:MULTISPECIES: HlyD family type I secretion periplasmic adaptor subunit [Pseudooceanicola]MBT9384130.1 HlyD family type I secretion periplasmic adaptor subunit [Pseudooceanicola endophyticus]MXN19771.1 HlyD family type I secretion periplasmic adaptor subunit [Pseudooceanicola albus]
MIYLRAARLPLALGLLCVALLIGGLGGWAATTRIAGAVIAPGRIEVERNRLVLQHPDGGTVLAVLVEEGQQVSAGQLLLRLDPQELRASLAVSAAQWSEAMARRARLEAERDDLPAPRFDATLTDSADPAVTELIDGQRRLFTARHEARAQAREQLRRRIGQIRAQIDGITAQQTALETQAELTRQQHETQAALLDKGLSQLARVLELRREAARLTGLMGDLDARRAEALGKITETEIEILRQQTTDREDAIAELRDLRVQELEASEKTRVLRDRIARLDITAPGPGTIHGLRVFSPGAVLRAAEPVLYLVPSDRPLVITARIDPLQIDALHLGQDVRLRFPAFDQRSTPELDGTLATLSADAFTDEATGISYYRAEIRLAEDAASHLPEGDTLIPGMPVEAFIRTADRSPLEFVTRPFTDYFTRAFRG